MRSLRSRPWTGPSRSFRCSPGRSSVVRTTTTDTAPRRCSPHSRSPPAKSPRRSSPSTAIRSSAALKPTHRHQEFLAFLRQIERTYRNAVDPETGEPVELHLVMDNYAAHKHQNVRDWLTQHPRFKVHFTPTHASWMNLVEVWFSLLERQAVRRGVFKSIKDLNSKLRAYIEGWNQRAHPFVWTKTADVILKKANRPTTSNPRH